MSEDNRRRRITRDSPGWMVTYADMMGLLLCLFILLLSFSEINSNSFRKNAGPINQAFGVSKTTPKLPAPAENVVTVQQPTPEDQRQVVEDRIIDLVETVLRDEIRRSVVDLEIKDDYAIIRFPGSAAFPSGEADLSPGFLPTLDKIAEVLRRTEGRILVSGHTDDQPISTLRFRSNWDLSAARSVSVVHYLLGQPGIDPKRVTAQGAAESRPLVANDTPENRARNRRVEIALEIRVPSEKKESTIRWGVR